MKKVYYKHKPYNKKPLSNVIPVQAKFSLINMSIRSRVDWLLIEWPSYIVDLLPKRGTCICAHAWIFFKLCIIMTHYIQTIKMYVLT